jgi:DNA-binding MarR family transcriptional regulator
MDSKIQDETRPDDVDAALRRSRLATGIKLALRDLRIQLSLLNHRVGARADLRDIDLDCLDLMARHGPLSPSALARQAGLHPATVTGIVDRLERAGWVARDRDPADRRAIVIRPLGNRARELIVLYSGMSGAMDDLLANYDETELGVIADFVRRTTEAGRGATDALSDDESGPPAR